LWDDDYTFLFFTWLKQHAFVLFFFDRKYCGGDPHSLDFINELQENYKGSYTPVLTESIKPKAKGGPKVVLKSNRLSKTFIFEIS
jgi:hypothetical protein